MPHETKKRRGASGAVRWHAAAAANAGHARREYGSYRREGRLYRQDARGGNQHDCATIATAEAIVIAGSAVAMGEAISVAARGDAMASTVVGMDEMGWQWLLIKCGQSIKWMSNHCS